MLKQRPYKAMCTCERNADFSSLRNPKCCRHSKTKLHTNCRARKAALSHYHTAHRIQLARQIRCCGTNIMDNVRCKIIHPIPKHMGGHFAACRLKKRVQIPPNHSQVALCARHRTSPGRCASNPGAWTTGTICTLTHCKKETMEQLGSGF